VFTFALLQALVHYFNQEKRTKKSLDEKTQRPALPAPSEKI